MFLHKLVKNVFNAILLSIPYYFVFQYFAQGVLDIKAIVTIAVVYIYIQHTKAGLKETEVAKESFVKKYIVNPLFATIFLYVLLIVNLLFRKIEINYIELIVGFFLVFVYYLVIFSIYFFLKRVKQKGNV